MCSILHTVTHPRLLPSFVVDDRRSVPIISEFPSFPAHTVHPCIYETPRIFLYSTIYGHLIILHHHRAFQAAVASLSLPASLIITTCCIVPDLIFSDYLSSHFITAPRILPIFLGSTLCASSHPCWPQEEGLLQRSIDGLVIVVSKWQYCYLMWSVFPCQSVCMAADEPHWRWSAKHKPVGAGSKKL